MPDQIRLTRLGAFDPASRAPVGAGGVTITALAPATRLVLRTVAGDADMPLKQLSLDTPINRFTSSEGRHAARLGPDEWLIIAPVEAGDALRAAIAAALARRHHALVDVSHRNVSLEIAGEGAELVLAAGCPLDLDPKAFPAGSATRTLIGKAEVVLLKHSEEPRFRVEVWRSYARYLHALLAEAAVGTAG